MPIDTTAQRATTEALASEYARTHSSEIEQRLLKHIDGYIEGMATRLLRRVALHYMSKDQLQECRCAAVAALRSYDPGRGLFRSWLLPYVKKALYRHRDVKVKVPEYILDASSKVERAKAAGIKTDADLCSAANISPDTLSYIKLAQTVSEDWLDWQDVTETVDYDADINTSLDIGIAFKNLGGENHLTAQICILFFSEEHSPAEISGELCVPVQVVEDAIHEGREFLQAALAAYAD